MDLPVGTSDRKQEVARETGSECGKQKREAHTDLLQQCWKNPHAKNTLGSATDTKPRTRRKGKNLRAVSETAPNAISWRHLHKHQNTKSPDRSRFNTQWSIPTFQCRVSCPNGRKWQAITSYYLNLKETGGCLKRPEKPFVWMMCVLQKCRRLLFWTKINSFISQKVLFRK